MNVNAWGIKRGEQKRIAPQTLNVSDEAIEGFRQSFVEHDNLKKGPIIIG